MRDPIPSLAGGIGTLISVAIFAVPISPAYGVEGMAATPPALGMAVGPLDPGMAGGGPVAPPPENPRVVVPAHTPVTVVLPPRRPRAFGGVAAGADGHLPNQRTGQHHEHVVRDICIGC